MTAVSPAAQLSGARTGMPLSEAKSLVGRSRQFQRFHVFEHNATVDLQQLQQLAVDCQRFSPIVGLENTSQVNERKKPAANHSRRNRQPSAILLDVTGLTHLFGGQNGLRLHVHRYFQSLGYLVCTAIAETVGKAWALARFAEQEIDTDQAVAGSGDGANDFESLPVDALRLQDTTVETLRQLGVYQVQHVRSLPRAGLRSRFGEEITWRLDQADGKIAEVVEAIYPPADYQVEKLLDYPITDRETIQVIVSRLAGQLCQQMRSNGRGGLVWQFQLKGPDSDPVDMAIKLFRPTANLEQLMPLVEMQMEDLFRQRKNKNANRSKGASKQRQRLHFQVQQLSVSVRNCVLLVEKQRQLFDENPRLDKQALGQLINRLSSRLGSENVLRPVLQSGAQVEDSYYFESLVGNQKVQQKRRSRTPSTISPLQRPLTLHPHPIPLSAVSVDGSQHQASNIPAVFLCQKRQYQVLRRWGPERIETAWWRGPTVRRDYWRIETEGQRWWWVYRDLQKRKWFLHGEF